MIFYTSAWSTEATRKFQRFFVLLAAQLTQVNSPLPLETNAYWRETSHSLSKFGIPLPSAPLPLGTPSRLLLLLIKANTSIICSDQRSHSFFTSQIFSCIHVSTHQSYETSWDWLTFNSHFPISCCQSSRPRL